MKTRIFNSYSKVGQVIFLICCLISVLILPQCTSQEKKIKTNIKTEITDTSTQKPVIEVKVDTTRGVFLIYKFGDTPEVVYQKTLHLLNKNIISKEVEKDYKHESDRYYYYYEILIDPKYSTRSIGHQVGDQFVEDGCYLGLEVSFEYFEEKLYKIKLYKGITNKQYVSLDENWRNYWEANTPKNIQALLDVYKKKYKGWTRYVSELGRYKYFSRNGNTHLLITDNLMETSVIYTDYAAEQKMKKQEKEKLKMKMDEVNKGI